MPKDSSRNPVALQTIRAWAGETIFKRRLVEILDALVGEAN